jgi:hypothetical protein
LKKKLSAFLLILCVVLAGCNSKNTWHNTTVNFPSPDDANAIIGLTLNIPPDVELTTASDGDKEIQRETLIYRDNSIVGNIVCDSVEIFSDQNSADEIYKRIISSENTDWSLSEEEERQKKGITVSTLKNADSDIGVLVYSQELDIYVGIKMLEDAFASEEVDMLIGSISLDQLDL